MQKQELERHQLLKYLNQPRTAVPDGGFLMEQTQTMKSKSLITKLALCNFSSSKSIHPPC